MCIQCVMCVWEEACLGLSLLFTVSVFVARRPVWWFQRFESELYVIEASLLLSAEIYEPLSDCVNLKLTQTVLCVSV